MHLQAAHLHARVSDGSTTARRRRAAVPLVSVPVTTVPKPRIENTRSIGSRGAPSVARSGTVRGDGRQRLAQRVETLRRSSTRPATIGASASSDPGDQLARLQPRQLQRLRIDEIGLGQHDDAGGTWSSRQIAKCSRVCGITDSSAAITSITASMPPTPASMFLTNRSWPGTSTNAMSTAADLGVREAEIDRDAARLLFLQAIRIGAGQRQHQRALAVIDVSGRADDDRLHAVGIVRSATALRIVAVRACPAAASRLPAFGLALALGLRACSPRPAIALRCAHALENARPARGRSDAAPCPP